MKFKSIAYTIIILTSSSLHGFNLIKAFKDLGNDIAHVATDGANWIAHTATTVGNTIAREATSLYQAGVNLAQAIGDKVKALGQDFYNKAIKPAADAIYNKALLPIEHVAEDVADHIKECGYLAQDSADLAAQETAKGVADAALIVAQQAADKTLAATKGTTQGVMVGTKGILEGVNQTTQGVLIGVEATTNGILTGVEQAIDQVLNSFNINKLRYHGTLQDLAKGVLGNINVSGKVLRQPINLTLDLDVHHPEESIKSIVGAIVNIMKDEVQKMIKIIS